MNQNHKNSVPARIVGMIVQVLAAMHLAEFVIRMLERAVVSFLIAAMQSQLFWLLMALAALAGALVVCMERKPQPFAKS